MKKISTLLLITGFANLVWAQTNIFDRNDPIYYSRQLTAKADPGSDPGQGSDDGDLGGEDDHQAPIDGYIPALMALGLGMAVYFGRKKYLLTN